MNAATIGKVIGDLQTLRDSARTGQAAGLAEAVDRLLVAESIITIRSMTGKEGTE